MAFDTRRQLGFTLIELMIAVAIVGILAAIAYPSYTSYVQNSRRADGQGALQRIVLEQEKWRANNTTYSSTLANLGFSGTTSAEGHYNLSISSATGTGYTATADPTGVQANDTTCDPMTIVVSNGGATITTNPSSCWKK